MALQPFELKNEQPHRNFTIYLNLNNNQNTVYNELKKLLRYYHPIYNNSVISVITYMPWFGQFIDALIKL